MPATYKNTLWTPSDDRCRTIERWRISQVDMASTLRNRLTATANQWSCSKCHCVAYNVALCFHSYWRKNYCPSYSIKCCHSIFSGSELNLLGWVKRLQCTDNKHAMWITSLVKKGACLCQKFSQALMTNTFRSERLIDVWYSISLWEINLPKNNFRGVNMNSKIDIWVSHKHYWIQTGNTTRDHSQDAVIQIPEPSKNAARWQTNHRRKIAIGNCVNCSVDALKVTFEKGPEDQPGNTVRSHAEAT